jgi:hypothetical protein
VKEKKRGRRGEEKDFSISSFFFSGFFLFLFHLSKQQTFSAFNFFISFSQVLEALLGGDQSARGVRAQSSSRSSNDGDQEREEERQTENEKKRKKRQTDFSSLLLLSQAERGKKKGKTRG